MSPNVIIGAGRTGRGLVARLLAGSGRPLVLIDTDARLVQALREQRRYTVSFFQQAAPPCTVGGYEAYTPDDPAALQAAAQSAFVFTAVAKQNLGQVGEFLCAAQSIRATLPSPQPLRVLTCENGISPSAPLREALGAGAQVGEAVIFYTTVLNGDTPLGVSSEVTGMIPYDGSAFTAVPGDGFTPVDRFDDLLARKIYTYNALNACIAYRGAYRGHAFLGQAAADEQIVPQVERLRAAIDAAICRRYSTPPEEQQEFSRRALDKFGNQQIVDPIERNVRDVLRKLGPQERILGTARLVEECGLDGTELYRLCAYALWYAMASGEIPLAGDRSDEQTVAHILRDVCGIDAPMRLEFIWREYAALVLPDGAGAS